MYDGLLYILAKSGAEQISGSLFIIRLGSGFGVDLTKYMLINHLTHGNELQKRNIESHDHES